MKSRTRKIIIAFVLLLCFTTGQIIILTHSHVTHSSTTTIPTKHSAAASTDENCKICQLNHNTTPLLNIDLPNAVIYGIAYKQLQAASISYQNISLVLAATRGPPLV